MIWAALSLESYSELRVFNTYVEIEHYAYLKIDALPQCFLHYDGPWLCGIMTKSYVSPSTISRRLICSYLWTVPQSLLWRLF
jgi:hypothetical protein